MMNRKKKNLTILLLAVLNFILTIFAITNLLKLNFFLLGVLHMLINL